MVLTMAACSRACTTACARGACQPRSDDLGRDGRIDDDLPGRRTTAKLFYLSHAPASMSATSVIGEPTCDVCHRKTTASSPSNSWSRVSNHVEP